MRHRLQSRRNEQGTVLVACIILTLILVSLVLWASKWSWDQGRVEVVQSNTQRARQYADSGISSAGPWLRRPSLKTDLPSGTSNSFSLPMPQGRCDVALYRTSTDASLVDIYATGYYYISQGAIDLQTGNPAQTVVINAKFQIANVTDYLMAVPGTLNVGYGTSAENGSIYASSLTFVGPGSGNPTSVGSAYYFSYISPDVSFVQFTSTPSAPQRLPFQPGFVSLGPTTRSQYASMPGVANLPNVMSGGIGVPASGIPVYMVTGDLEIGQGQPLVVQGVYVVYVTGSIRIHNNITLADNNSWAGFMSEQNIDIASDAPDTLTVNGTFVSNGPFAADGAPRSPSSSLTFNGGIVSMATISISQVYANRTYSYPGTAYPGSTDPSLLLPNITSQLQYTVLAGRTSMH